MNTAVTTNSDFAEAWFKSSDGERVSTTWAAIDAEVVARGSPWRTFPWYQGQRNYSGRYWCATERKLVGYESLLERSNLMILDFDRSVTRIASQPFWLKARVDGEHLRRTPDYLVCTDQGPVVVDVTRARRMAKPEFRHILDLTRVVVESRGWRYEVVHEPERTKLLNVRFLSGYRRSWLFRTGVLDAIRFASTKSEAPTVAEIISGTDYPRAIALAGTLHLLWQQELKFNINKRLSTATIVEAAR
jgi:hypothetical protein